jgi:hypothetical protein
MSRSLLISLLANLVMGITLAWSWSLGSAKSSGRLDSVVAAVEDSSIDHAPLVPEDVSHSTVGTLEQLENAKREFGQWTIRDAPAIVAWLKEMGADPRAIYDVLQSFSNRDAGALRSAFLAERSGARWNSMNVRLTREESDAVDERRRQNMEVIRTAMGDDWVDFEAEMASGLTSRFGDLSSDKIARLHETMSEYAEINRTAAKSLGPHNFRNKQTEIEAEMIADLREFLSPEELADFIAFNSLEAQSLQRRLSGASIDDHEYRKIFDALAAHRQSTDASPVGSAGRTSSAAMQSEMAVVRSAADPETAVVFAKNQNEDLGTIVGVFQSAGLPASEILQRYDAYIEFHMRMEGMDPASRAGQGAALGPAQYEEIHRTLTRGLSEADLRGFERTRFGAFLRRRLSGG